MDFDAPKYTASLGTSGHAALGFSAAVVGTVLKNVGAEGATVNDVKTNSGQITHRLQEPSSEKTNNARIGKKLVDNVKATGNHIVHRPQEHLCIPETDYIRMTQETPKAAEMPQGLPKPAKMPKELPIEELPKEVTFNTTENKTPAIEKCTDI